MREILRPITLAFALLLSANYGFAQGRHGNGQELSLAEAKQKAQLVKQKMNQNRFGQAKNQLRQLKRGLRNLAPSDDSVKIQASIQGSLATLNQGLRPQRQKNIVKRAMNEAIASLNSLTQPFDRSLNLLSQALQKARVGFMGTSIRKLERMSQLLSSFEQDQDIALAIDKSNEAAAELSKEDLNFRPKMNFLRASADDIQQLVSTSQVFVFGFRVQAPRPRPRPRPRPQPVPTPAPLPPVSFTQVHIAPVFPQHSNGQGLQAVANCPASHPVAIEFENDGNNAYMRAGGVNSTFPVAFSKSYIGSQGIVTFYPEQRYKCSGQGLRQARQWQRQNNRAILHQDTVNGGFVNTGVYSWPNCPSVNMFLSNGARLKCASR